ncbi:helix-turn-helix domain-containing protein [Vallitalea maricola]|uniref:Uncharacterized protein n=1 Tax=Vallitalea maricola TaxID=3074433 RepID=A0ACB5UF44_9FIRM|nr:hypothetical protein AN2V17_03970 [Vallitalea sp. AN17-2]
MAKTRRMTTEFGKQVKQALIQKNLTQHDLALIVGISDSYLCDILKGLKRPQKHVNQICSILEIEEKKIAS